jgi:A/G-specific adenine glycosylase
MKFAKVLIDWYEKNMRDLPWRKTQDPYRIWLSEVILQQTRISQGLSYYLKFVDAFPDVYRLADASEQEILKLWQGLGYYSRARNMHNTAKTIVTDFNGFFPEKSEELIKLKGIGSYTAAAVASLAFGEISAVVDGNVIRLLSRIRGIRTPMNSASARKEISGVAMELIDRKRPGIFNQALMEFGALYCKPKNPNCENCVFNSECQALRMGLVSEIPMKINRLMPKKRYFNYLVVSTNDRWLYLKKRTRKDIWQNLYDFPVIEANKRVSNKKILEEITLLFDRNETREIKVFPTEYKHVLTHQVIFARFYSIKLTMENPARFLDSELGRKTVRVNFDKLQDYPVPRLIENFLKKFLL